MSITFSKKDIQNNKTVKRIKKFTNSSFFAKTIIGIVLWVGALIPTWIYFLIRWAAGPDGFWEEFALIAICLIVIGWLQALLFFFAFVLTIVLILEDEL